MKTGPRRAMAHSSFVSCSHDQGSRCRVPTVAAFALTLPRDRDANDDDSCTVIPSGLAGVVREAVRLDGHPGCVLSGENQSYQTTKGPPCCLHLHGGLEPPGWYG